MASLISPPKKQSKTKTKPQKTINLASAYLLRLFVSCERRRALARTSNFSGTQSFFNFSMCSLSMYLYRFLKVI